MRFTSTLAFAFLAIVAQINSATAIAGQSLKMVANSNSASSFVASFKDRRGVDDTNKELRFDAVLVGKVGDYTEMKCITELDRESARPSVIRSYPVGLEEYRHQSVGYVGFKGAVRLGPVDALGDFDLVCSFVPLIEASGQSRSTVYASIDTVEGFVIAHATIHPYNGFVETFEASIATARNPYTRTTFKFTNPDKVTDSRTFRIQSPGGNSATTGAVLVFKAPFEQDTTYCDAYFDNVLFKRDVTATVSYDGKYIDLTFLTSISSYSTIIVHCDRVVGKTLEPVYPAILEVTRLGSSVKKNYVLAKIITEKENISFDFSAEVQKAFPELFH